MNASNAAASARRLAPGGLLALLALVALVGLLSGCGGGGGAKPPADAATKLVPAGALVYVHLSTDTSRDATKRAAKVAAGFPSFATLRATLLRRLSAPSCGIDVARLRGGKEAALALIDTGSGTAGSLVLVDLGKAETRRERTCGAVQVAQIGRFLVIGQPQTLQVARQLARGKGRSLADARDYRRATDALPADRVLDAWASRGGVRRLLAPQGGLLGAAGVLLDQPALKGAALGVSARDGGARVTIKSILDPVARKRAGTAFKAFKPTLQAAVPADAFAYLGVSGLSSAAGRLLAALGSRAAQLGPLLQGGGKELAPLLALFRGEVAVTLTRATPAPVLTLIARAKDPRQAAAVLRRMPKALARLFHSAVVDGKVVVSTSARGIQSVRDAKDHLPDSAKWRGAVGNTQNPVTSLVFLDFNQLLRLGEQTGLNDSSAYRALKRDLQRVSAVGAQSSSTGDESTAEIFLSIP